MPKAKTSSVKKSSGRTTKTKKTASTAKKKTSAQKTSKKKVAPKKKRAVKKSVKQATARPLSVTVIESSSDAKPRIHISSTNRTLLNKLPVIDLDQLSSMPESSPVVEEPVQPVAHIRLHSRIAFYLGVFLGAVVVNAFLVTILAVMTA